MWCLFPRVLKLVVFPVDGCPVRENNPGRFREHFMHWNWKARVVIIQEGPEPITRYHHYEMHMPAARQIKYIRTARCDKATDMWLIPRHVEMGENCGEMEFRLYGREGGELVEGVVNFNCLPVEGLGEIGEYSKKGRGVGGRDEIRPTRVSRRRRRPGERRGDDCRPFSRETAFVRFVPE